MKTSTRNLTELLDLILPEHPKASMMGDDPVMERGKLYKTIDQNEVVWLIENPICWVEIQRENGTRIRRRVPPKRMGTIAELQRHSNVLGLGYTPQETLTW